MVFSGSITHKREQGPVLNPEECTGIFLKTTEIALNEYQGRGRCEFRKLISGQ